MKMMPRSSFNMTVHYYTRLNTQEAITKPGWTVHPYPQYRPDLAASECHLFGAHKGAICSTKFGSDDEVTEEVAVSTKFKLVQEDALTGVKLLKLMEIV
jgi:hypothetical protein